MPTRETDFCLEPTLESTFNRSVELGPRARGGAPPRAPGAPRRAMFIAIAAAAALIGFTTGRTLYARTSDAPPLLHGPAPASAPSHADACPLPHFAPPVAAPVAAALAAPVAAPVATAAAPLASETSLAVTAGGLAGWSPRQVPHASPVTRSRRARFTVGPAVSPPAPRTAPLAPPAPPVVSALAVAAPAAPLPTSARQRDLENVTRELASTF